VGFDARFYGRFSSHSPPGGQWPQCANFGHLREPRSCPSRSQPRVRFDLYRDESLFEGVRPLDPQFAEAAMGLKGLPHLLDIRTGRPCRRDRSRFAARCGRPARLQCCFLMTTLLADATNLGLARMARRPKMFSHSKLLWIAEWHIRNETYQAGLACLVDGSHAQPFTKVWGDGDASSSDGQFFKAGGHGEARVDYTAARSIFA
jgi:hypothetical protein